jgi:hypothetical protein
MWTDDFPGVFSCESRAGISNDPKFARAPAHRRSREPCPTSSPSCRKPHDRIVDLSSGRSREKSENVEELRGAR